ncbi:MAG: CocE/NonD family hydrolase [Anaerolineae bacterium]
MSSTRLLIERDVDATMRDGTVLRANIYRPEVSERLPVLLFRTPYNKNAGADFCLRAAARGYVVVAQDTRGRYASDGEFTPLLDDLQDGYDTVQWAAELPWSNGDVAMWGGSYNGWTQWAAASQKPPALKALVPQITFADIYRDFLYPGGALSLGVALTWCLGTEAGARVDQLDLKEEERAALRAAFLDALDETTARKRFEQLPLLDDPILGREDLAPGYVRMLRERHVTDWEAGALLDQAAEASIPALHMGGWYDLFAASTTGSFSALRDHGATQQGREGQRLIMGPWAHGPATSTVGDAEFGVRSSALFLDLEEMMLQWFDHWLKGESFDWLKEPPVRLFVMGENRWRHEENWPLARAVETPYYLTSQGSANSLHGDGRLTSQAPDAAPPDHFTYDPSDPVPTRGGGLCCWAPALPPGAYDQRVIEERQDVLVYTSEPLEEALEVTGAIRVILYAATSAVDTDWTAKLVDVEPCGYARNLCDGIVRARFHDPLDPALVSPGEIVRYEIALGPTSNLFLPGHAIRVEISSSNFPRFDRNLNTGQDSAISAEMVAAQQAVYHDAECRSCVLLPVVPRT